MASDSSAPTLSFCATLASGLDACAAAAQESNPEASVAQKLKVGADESLAMIVGATGAPIYESRAAKALTPAYEWAFVGPEADLFDPRGMKVGRHYAGPHWEAVD